MTSFKLTTPISKLGLQPNTPIQRTIGTVLPPVGYGQNIGDQFFNKTTGEYFVFTRTSSGVYTWSKVLLDTSNSGGPYPYIIVTASQTLPSNYDVYVDSGNTPILLALPSSASVGSVINLFSMSDSTAPITSPGFTVTQGFGQQIFFDNTVYSTLGSAGGFATSSPGAVVELRCVTANSVWNVNVTSGGLKFF